MELDRALLQDIVRGIVSVANPDRIILFGSAATGTMGRDSDIDLLVLESSEGDAFAEQVRIRRALGFVPLPVDVFVMRTDRFEESKYVFGGLAFPAHKYGRVVYKKAA